MMRRTHIAPRRPAAAALIVTGLVLASCGGGSDGGDEAAGGNTPNDPSVTFGTTPPAGSADTVDVGSEPDAGDGSTEPADAPTTTEPLVASDSADLPTAPPDELAAPTTVALPSGPLPTPAVALVEFGQFQSPVELTTRPGDPRNFVVEQGGRVIAADDLSTEVVLDMTDLTEANGEAGLLGLAFHPDQDLAYVHYDDLDGDTVVDEYAIDPVNAVFDPASRREVLTVDQPFGNHNGGELAFGPDGLLYLGLGDGGSANDPERNSLALSTRLGKILRIDPQAAGDEPFVVPDDNPFVDVDGADPAIWALGLRNPWKFSFDVATGDLWIADVGQGEIEEINRAAATNGVDAGRGVSFGWSAFEGTARFNEDQDPDGHTPPVVEYSHGDGNCSVSGGAVYRGEGVADLAGWYVYGDFCSGTIWGYDTTSPADAPVVVELAQLPNLVAVAVGGEGDLYAVSNVGTVARFAPA